MLRVTKRMLRPYFAPHFDFRTDGFSDRLNPPGSYPLVSAPDVSGVDPDIQVLQRYTLLNPSAMPSDGDCVTPIGGVVQVIQVTGAFIDQDTDGTVKVSGQATLPNPPPSMPTAFNTTGQFLIYEGPDILHDSAHTGNFGTPPYEYRFNVVFDYIPRWVTPRTLRDDFDRPIGPFTAGNSTRWRLTSVYGFIPSDFATDPAPDPGDATSTVPFDAFVWNGDPPQVKTSIQVGTYNVGGVHYSIWQPSPDANYDAGIPSWKDVIGYTLTTSDTGDFAGEGTPSISPPALEYTFVFDRRTFHAWTGPLAKAPGDLAGYLYHTDETSRYIPNPPVGVIYPYYTTPRTP